MSGNLYLIEIIYVFFYALLFLFIYFNYVAITNFSESNKIIIENASPQCLPSVKNLPFLSTADGSLIACTNKENNGKFYYYDQKNNLAFILSNNQADAKNYFKICSYYCKGNFDPTSSKCNAPNKGPFNACIGLLEPPPKCTNSSRAIAVNKTDDSILYATRAADEHSPNPC